MKFGEMKYDVPFEKIKNHHWDFNPLQEFMIELEGKRLYKSHPEYSYLQEDPWLKTDRDFYESIVFAYMMDFIKQNDPQYLEYYIKVYGEKTQTIKDIRQPTKHILTDMSIIFVNKQIPVVSNVNAKKRKKSFKNLSLSTRQSLKWTKNVILMCHVPTASLQTPRRSVP